MVHASVHVVVTVVAPGTEGVRPGRTRRGMGAGPGGAEGWGTETGTGTETRAAAAAATSALSAGRAAQGGGCRRASCGAAGARDAGIGDVAERDRTVVASHPRQRERESEQSQDATHRGEA